MIIFALEPEGVPQFEYPVLFEEHRDHRGKSLKNWEGFS
jgi:hypothetical protein